MTSPSLTTITKSSLWLMGSFALAKGLQLVAQVILARLLLPEDFGIWGMVLLAVTLSALFKENVLASVLIQRGLEDKALVNAVYSLTVNISLGMFFLQAISAYPLALFFGVSDVGYLTAVVALIFLINAGSGTHSAVLASQMQFKRLAVIDSISSLVRSGSTIICAISGAGVWSFVVGEIAMAIVDSSLKRTFSRYRFTYSLVPNADAIKKVRGYISSLVGINLAVYANTNVDNLIIGKVLGTQALGYYNLAYQLAMLPGFVLSQINRVNFSVLSRKEPDAQKQYMQRLLEIYALIYAPLYGIAWVIAPWSIPMVYGSRWQASVPLFQVVVVFAYTRGFMAILGTTLNALNRPNLNAAINWVLVPLALAAFYIGAIQSGVMGVAISVALVMGVGAMLWFWIAVSRATGWSFFSLFRSTVWPTITIVGLVASVQVLPLSGLVPNYFTPILILIVYGAVLSLTSAGRIPRRAIAAFKNRFKLKFNRQ